MRWFGAGRAIALPEQRKDVRSPKRRRKSSRTGRHGPSRVPFQSQVCTCGPELRDPNCMSRSVRRMNLSAVRPVVPRSRGVPRRAWHRRRSRQLVPVGATFHASADRRGPSVPPHGRQPVVCRRNIPKIAGVWRYVYRAVDQRGQVLDIYVSPRRDTAAARKFFEAALRTRPSTSRPVPFRGDPRSRVHAEPTPGHYELGTNARNHDLRVAAAFDELATTI